MILGNKCSWSYCTGLLWCECMSSWNIFYEMDCLDFLHFYYYFNLNNSQYLIRGIYEEWVIRHADPVGIALSIKFCTFLEWIERSSPSLHLCHCLWCWIIILSKFWANYRNGNVRVDRMQDVIRGGGILPRCLLFVDITINCESCIVTAIGFRRVCLYGNGQRADVISYTE